MLLAFRTLAQADAAKHMLGKVLVRGEYATPERWVAAVAAIGAETDVAVEPVADDVFAAINAQIQGAELTQNSFALGYARSLNVFGKSGGDRPRTSFFRNCEKREVTPSLHDQPSQCYRLEKLELQQSLRIHYCRASGMPIMRLAPCLRWTVRFDGARLHRDIAAVY